MNMNIYLEDKLAKQLSRYAKEFHLKKNTIIREAIKEWLTNHTTHKWPSSVLNFEGMQGFPDIKELRNGLLESTKKLF